MSSAKILVPALLAAITACSNPTAKSADASHSTSDAPTASSDARPLGPYACLGVPLPMEAASNLTISGVTRRLAGTMLGPNPGAIVTAFGVGDSLPIATATSDAAGVYSVAIAGMGAPTDHYVKASKADVLDAYFYPATVLYQPVTDARLTMLSAANVGLLGTVAGTQQDLANKAFVGVTVVDCTNTPLAGAIITSTAGGKVTYNSAQGLPSAAATQTAGDGLAYIFNVTPGAVTLAATVNGMVLRAHTIEARINAVTTTAIAP